MPDPLYHAGAFATQNEDREDRISTGLANQQQRQQARHKRLADRFKSRKKKAPKKSSGGGRGGGVAAPSPSTPTPDPLIEALVRLKYGEAERGLGDQIHANQIHAQRVPGWYDQYIAQLGQMQNAAAQSAVALQNSMRPGLSTNPAVNTPESQQAANARNNLHQSGLNVTGAQAQNHYNLLASLQAAGGLGKIDALKATANDGRGLQAKLSDLQREKGDFRVTAKQDLQDAKVKSALDNAKLQIAMQEFGLDAKKVGISEKLANSLVGDRRADNRRQTVKDRADISHKGQKLALDERKLTIGQRQKAHDKEMKRRAGVRKENAKLSDQTSRGEAILRQYQASLKGKPVPHRQALIDLLETSKHGISHKAAVRAVKKFLGDGKRDVPVFVK